jgi:hypothetical protein
MVVGNGYLSETSKVLPIIVTSTTDLLPLVRAIRIDSLFNAEVAVAVAVVVDIMVIFWSVKLHFPTNSDQPDGRHQSCRTSYLVSQRKQPTHKR